MSYILDALRKSDQQRQRGAVPTLVTAPEPSATPRQPAYYGLIAAVLLCAGIAIGWLRPWQPEQVRPATGPVAPKPPESAPRQTTPGPSPALPQVARKQETQPPRQKSTSPPQPARAAVKEDARASARNDTPGAPSIAVTAVPKSAATPMPSQPVGKGATEGAPDQKVMTLSELPLPIQQEMPAMSVSIHAYSAQPHNRLVGINERMLREGGDVAPGLRLEQITPDGMIFTYKGYRFSRGVRGSGSKAESQ